MNADQIVEARALASSIPITISAVDKGPWMVVQYVPDLGTGGAAATVTVAAAAKTITFQVDSADPATTDVIGNTSGEIFTDDTYDTMGELVDHINGHQAWRAYLVGALRADLPSNLLNFSAASCIGAHGKTMYGDTTDSMEISMAISGEKFVNNGRAGWETDWDDQCENSMEYGSFTVTSASYAVLRYYGGKAGSAEVQIASDVDLTTATEKEQGESNPTEPWIKAVRGHRLIVRVIGLSNTEPSVPTINVIGKTAVLSNRRIVTEAAFE